MRKKAIVLGGTAPHAELIRRLNNKGYETILIDYLDDSAAKPYACRHIQESTLDKEKVLEIAQLEKPEFVIAVCVDQANATACYVSEKLGLPHPYSYETALAVTQKGRMKELFICGGIPTSAYYTISREETPEIRLDFPLVIKPTDSNSSKGVFKIKSEREFYQRINESFAYSREGRVIVEEYVEGTEIQVDCIAINGKAHVLMVKDMIPMDYGDNEMNVTGYISPGPACEANISQIEEIAQKIVDVFGLKTTAFFYQAKCNSSGVYVLEFAARCAGGSAFAVVGLRCGMDYLDLSADAYLQKPISLILKPNTQKFIGYFLYMKPGCFEKLEGVEQQLQSGNIHEIYMSAIKHMKVEANLHSGGRIAVILTLCDSYAAGLDKMRNALSNIRVLDPDGNDMGMIR